MSLVVFDCEWTSWEGSIQRMWSGPGEHRELVQIGALRLDGALAETASFAVLVRPSLNPVLSDYFINLTGIRQADVAAQGRSLAEALAAFRDFAGDATAVWSNGGDHAVIAANLALVGLPAALDLPFGDLAPFFRRVFRSERHVTTSTLPERLGLPPAGRSHDALADARALAAALRHLAARGVYPEATGSAA